MLRVEILDTRTSESVCYLMDSIDDKDFDDFIWAEGNFACDCNRGLFFARAKNDEESAEHECGSERFVITQILDESLNKVYGEN